MNINELDKDIQRHKDRSPETYNDIINFTIPFYMFYQKLVDGITDMQSEKYNINNSELDVLASLKISGNEEYILSPTKLNERLLFTSGAITKVLKKLEEKKYIERIDNQFDKRSKLVKLTESGVEIINKVLKDVIDYEVEFMSALSDEEKNTMRELFIKVLKSR